MTSMIRFVHMHGVFATEQHGEWLIVYTHGSDPIDGHGMAFRTVGALAEWFGY